MLPEMDLLYRKALKNHVSHIKFEQTVQKLSMHDIFGGHLGFSVSVHFRQTICKVVHIGGYYVGDHVMMHDKLT